MKLMGWSLLLLGIACLSGANPVLSSGGSEADKERQYLREQYLFFQSLKPSRQQELRKLDQEFFALDEETQKRLGKVLDNYNWWISQLSDADRKRVADADTPKARLTIIRELKDQEWIKTLSQAQREEYAAAAEDKRIGLREKWRLEQDTRHQTWLREAWLEGHSRDEGKPKIPEIFQELRLAIETYAANLDTQLSSSNRDRLKTFRDQPPEEREWLKYFRLLVDLADRSPLLPGPPDGPRHFDALPDGVKKAFEKAEPKVFNIKKKNLPQELQKSQGRWPEFALAVSDYASQHRIALPEPIVPCGKADMPIEVRTFIDKTLEPLLTQTARGLGDKAEQARKDLARLKEAEGRWPDYPRTIVELAKQHKLIVPGWMLPGRAEVWERYRMKLPKKG